MAGRMTRKAVFKIGSGDTFASISQQLFDAARFAPDIVVANPNVHQLFTGGTLNIPADPRIRERRESARAAAFRRRVELAGGFF